MTYTQLIQTASELIHPKQVPGGLIGDVGCALISASGEVFTGVCVASGSNTFCAEVAAIGAMITAGQYRIQTLVATWKDDTGAVFVIPPCGNCRQLMKEIDERNLSTAVVLDHNQSVSLAELLPFHNHWQKQPTDP